MGVCGRGEEQDSVEVLRDPPESLSVSLPLEDGAHEELERPGVQLRPRHLALARRLAVQAKHLPELQENERKGVQFNNTGAKAAT